MIPKGDMSLLHAAAHVNGCVPMYDISLRTQHVDAICKYFCMISSMLLYCEYINVGQGTRRNEVAAEELGRTIRIWRLLCMADHGNGGE